MKTSIIPTAECCEQAEDLKQPGRDPVEPQGEQDVQQSHQLKGGRDDRGKGHQHRQPCQPLVVELPDAADQQGLLHQALKLERQKGEDVAHRKENQARNREGDPLKASAWDEKAQSRSGSSGPPSPAVRW
jgi:hypothetical protein